MADVLRVSRHPHRAADPSDGASEAHLGRWLRCERVLEVGADDRTVRKLLDRGVSITSITSDEAQFDKARERLGGGSALLERLRLELVRTSEWPFPENAFDSIVVDAMIGHALVPHRLFAEMRRVLRPGGSLIIHARYGRAPHGRHHDELYILDLRAAMSGSFQLREAYLLQGRLVALANEGESGEESNEALLAIAESALRRVELELELERARADGFQRRWNRLLRNPIVRLARAARHPARTLRRSTGRG
jgi:SAM-dependent methyltransferase